jgi:hypothetical protein
LLGLFGEGAAAQLKIAVQAPPVEGRANSALIAFLADTFGVAGEGGGQGFFGLGADAEVGVGLGEIEATLRSLANDIGGGEWGRRQLGSPLTKGMLTRMER